MKSQSVSQQEDRTVAGPLLINFNPNPACGLTATYDLAMRGVVTKISVRFFCCFYQRPIRLKLPEPQQLRMPPSVMASPHVIMNRLMSSLNTCHHHLHTPQRDGFPGCFAP